MKLINPLQDRKSSPAEKHEIMQSLDEDIARVADVAAAPAHPPVVGEGAMREASDDVTDEDSDGDTDEETDEETDEDTDEDDLVGHTYVCVYIYAIL